jgi:formate-dependent phosphoribosylglycinamide formyltransferase (GAR transformylase)
LSSPEQGQPLILYVSATHTVVSRTLVIEKEAAQGAGAVAKHQHPVYFISEVLAGSKKYYSEIEKICYAVIMCSRKLRHYFEAHTIRVLTNQPLHGFFGNRDNSGRIKK